MGSAYLLPCSCGEEVPVSIAQAGGVVRCKCGKDLPVPTMRGIRDLKEAEAVLLPKVGTWGRKQQVLMLLFTTAIGSFAVGSYYWYHQPMPYSEYVAKLLQEWKTQLPNTSPAVAYDFWVKEIEPLEKSGLYDRTKIMPKEWEDAITYSQMMRNIFYGIALLFAMLGVGLMFKKAKEPLPKA